MRNLIVKISKDIIPPFLLKLIKKIHYSKRLVGKFKEWDDALVGCGYNNINIINALVMSDRELESGNGRFQRDGRIFYKEEYSQPLLLGLFLLLQNYKFIKLNILDFGGGLRTTYDQHKKYFTDKINWNIIERSEIVDYAINNNKYKNLFYYKNIKYYSNININTDLIFLSASLQYCKNPFSILEELIALNAKIIVIDRISISINDEDEYLMIENVPKYIYNASYPIWIFNKKRLIKYMESLNYNFFDKFESADKLSFDINWISIIFVKNEN